MKIISLFVPLSILILASCTLDDKENIVTINKKYSISLPSFLINAKTILEKDELNENTSLQYMNTLKELYVLIIEDSKSDFQQTLVENNLNDKYTNDFKGYTDFVFDYYKKQTKISHKFAISDTLINNKPAKLISISGEINEVNVFYTIGLVEGKKTYYQIITWTLAGFENKYKDRMKKIIYSFKEL